MGRFAADGCSAVVYLVRIRQFREGRWLARTVLKDSGGADNSRWVV